MKCLRCNRYHRYVWHPRGQFPSAWDDKECEDGDHRDWYERIDDETFHLEGIKRMVCKTCGGDRFQVGSGNWRTVAKCCGCGWEAVVHDG